MEWGEEGPGDSTHKHDRGKSSKVALIYGTDERVAQEGVGTVQLSSHCQPRTLDVECKYSPALDPRVSAVRCPLVPRSRSLHS